MRLISIILKTFAIIVSLYIFSGISVVWGAGTCAIGYVDNIQYSTGHALGFELTAVQFTTDGTGFVSPSNPSEVTVLGKRATGLWWEPNDGSALFGFAYDILKLSLAARLPIRVWTDGGDCRGPTDDFIIYLCSKDVDCNR